LTYARGNRVPSPPPSTTLPPPQAKQDPPQLIKEVSSTPPSPLHDLLPKPTPMEEEIQLNIDMLAMVKKMDMPMPFAEMCKIP